MRHTMYMDQEGSSCPNPKVTWRTKIVLNYFQPNLKEFAKLFYKISIKSDCTNVRDRPNDTKNNKFEDGL